ncbi:conserved hypothetical protein [Tenacibaculum litopenaei]|jgi:hypothetical protein|uniref:hypothetical protein n=1 Tax=Tenacibaculum litopenaei TaxID=396016 RepID=UPI003894E258
MEAVKTNKVATQVPGKFLTFVKATKGAEVKFAISTQRLDKRPLSPMVLGTYNSECQIVISAVVFVPKTYVEAKQKKDPNWDGSIEFQVNVGELSNTEGLEFHIAYDNSPGSFNDYYAYNVNFSTVEAYKVENREVEVIFYDEDPEGSRGTVTTVKDPMGGS